MLRRITGGLVVLMLIASMLSPMGTLAQSDEEGSSAPPVAVETVTQQAEPPAVEEELPAPVPGNVEPDVEVPAPELPAADPPPETVVEPDTTEPAEPEPASGEMPVPANETEDSAEPAPDASAEVTAAEPEDEAVQPAAASVISDVSVTCDGALSFTILEAAGETLSIYLRDPWAPTPFDQLDAGSHLASETGTVQLQFAIPTRDTVIATVYSPASETSWSAGAYHCLYEEEPTTGLVTGLTIDCSGAVSFSVTDVIEGGTSVVLYHKTATYEAAVDSLPLGYFTTAGSYAHTFALPAGGYDHMVVRVGTLRWWEPHAVAAVSGCHGTEDPDPDPDPTGTRVSNLQLFCNGLVRFDLDTTGTATVDIDLRTAASEPPFERSTSVALGAGSHQVQFGVPVAWYDAFDVSLSEGGTPLAAASIGGCLTTDPNDVTGEDIMVVTRAGSVIFSRVTAGGETIIDRYSQPNPPALPAGFDADSASYFDLSTTVTHDGPIEVCLGMDQAQSDRSGTVRLLQFAEGTWTDVTASIDSEWHRVCGTTDRLSVFAIAVRSSDTEPEPDDPNTPAGPAVSVPVEGGTISFDMVTQPGTTTVTVLDPANAPPIPAIYDPASVILLDISTTAVFAGAVEICLPMGADLTATAADVRLLHYTSGAWVDITTSASATTGLVCGVTDHLSPFAIVRPMAPDPGEPGVPNPGAGGGDPAGPGHGVPSGGSTSGAAPASAAVDRLPVTGSGSPASQTGSLHGSLMLAILALVVAAALIRSNGRSSTPAR